jgi:hypothetical protein
VRNAANKNGEKGTDDQVGLEEMALCVDETNRTHAHTYTVGEEGQPHIREYKVVGKKVCELEEHADAAFAVVRQVVVCVVFLRPMSTVPWLCGGRTWISPQKRMDTMPVSPNASASKNELYEIITNMDVSTIGYFCGFE